MSGNIISSVVRYNGAIVLWRASGAYQPKTGKETGNGGGEKKNEGNEGKFELWMTKGEIFFSSSSSS